MGGPGGGQLDLKGKWQQIWLREEGRIQKARGNVYRAEAEGGARDIQQWKLARVAKAKQATERAAASSSRDSLAFKKLGLYTCQ